jgi:exosortase/archaeosortase family protein
MNFLKGYGLFLMKFLGVFCILFYGTEAIIGLSSKDNHYNTFVATYLNYISPLRYALLFSAKTLLTLLNHQVYFRDEFTLAVQGGSGVRMVYSCIGYGVMSFWAAFVFANKGSWKIKACWIAGGCAALYLLNVIRLSLLLIAVNGDWPIPLGWDHHTWFNLVAYALIFTMIYFFDKTSQKKVAQAAVSESNIIANEMV